MADPLCRWRNSTPKTVCELVSQLPKDQLTSVVFRSIMKNSIYGDGFFTTPYQLACQLGLYVEDKGMFIPRFKRDISEEEALAYLQSWFQRYYVPNPYTKRGFQNMLNPVIVVDAFIAYLKEHNFTANFQDIALAVFGEPINNVDILVNCFRYYSSVITVDKDLTTTLSHDYERILKTIDMDRIDKSAFFQQFNVEHKGSELNIDRPLQLIYYGAPGTGKSFAIDKVTNENNSVRTTFHPDSDYAGFVGAYKPTMESVPLSAFVGKEVHVAQPQGEHTGKERKIVYKYVPQAFLKAYVEAWKRYAVGELYYLVIEEINRGNCAQIFGDLFQLLDRNSVGSSSYSINADEDIAQFLREDKKGFASLTDEQMSAIKDFVLKKDCGSEELIGPSILDGSKLLLPPNLCIWATMNTSDQSLFPIDGAFKRRWNWEYMPIEYDKKNWTFIVGVKRFRWGDFLREINPKIFKLTQSEDKQMGYFFAKPDKRSKDELTENDTISERIFVNKVLFYLWTDVFKDYDLTEAPFVYEDKEGKNVAYRFTDFFSTNGADLLTRFIDGFELPVVGEQAQNETPNAVVSGEFSVNGTPVRWQNGVPAIAVEKYIELYPEKTTEAVIQDWRSLKGPLVSHFIETEAENDARTDKDKDYVVKIDCNGETIYVSKQGWGDNRPNGSYYALLNLVNAIRTKGWPIDIEGVG